MFSFLKKKVKKQCETRKADTGNTRDCLRAQIEFQNFIDYDGREQPPVDETMDTISAATMPR